MGLLNSPQSASVIYHDLFDYPLKEKELDKWQLVQGTDPCSNKGPSLSLLSLKDGFYFKTGRERIIKKRLFRERESEKKLVIAKRAGKILGRIPTVEMVAITGSLAMKNADENSDVDLMIITQAGTLWLTRGIILMMLIILRIPTRRYDDKNQKNKLCLNLWLDGADLVWPKEDRNSYTAHEIAQIIPLVNRHHTYEQFINSNRWLLDWWPNAIQKLKFKNQNYNSKLKNFCWLFEKPAFWVQYLYMRHKITNEVITSTRAVFHPRRFPLDNFKSFLIK